MPIFKCKLGEASGKVVEQEIEATDIKSLRDRLERDGRLVFDIVEKGASLSSSIALIKKGKIRSEEFLIFNQELVALLKSGLPLLTSIETLADKEEDRYFKEILGEVALNVKEGSAFSEALQGAPQVFKKLYISSVKAGEKSGNIVENIRRYITYLKKVEELKKKVFNASIYPAILLSVAVIVVFFLLFYVVPSFSQIFKDSGADLPLPTQILISTTEFLRNNVLLLALLVILVSPSFFIMGKSRAMNQRFKKFMISAPWVGDILKKYAIAKYSRTLSTLLKSGEPLVSALGMAAGTMDNSYMEHKITLVCKEVKEGDSLALALEKTGLMPSTALKMIMVGEESGSLEEMFENVADLFEDEVDRRLNFITTVIEPVLMLSMGLVVAFIVVAMYLPIFRLAGAVR